MKLSDRVTKAMSILTSCKQMGVYPYFRPISKSWGSEVEIGGKRLIMIGSNDYLGLAHDPEVMEASAKAVMHWGTGPGGSRFLSGNMTIHLELEERLAAFTGKKKAVLHVTGFSTNLGALGTLLSASDMALFDRESHASIIEGVRVTKARMATFAHNDTVSAGRKIAAHLKNENAGVFLVTEGIFSMSGDIAPMDKLAALKDAHPGISIYLDDAHGLGVLGQGGRGSANHFGVTDKVDYIMGTFSKAFASIGGFLASDDEDVIEYVRHQSRTQIFSAALPAGNTAAVLACLDIVERESERVERLRAIIARMRQGYRDIGLSVTESVSPIIPIHIGSDEKAFLFSQELMEQGIFALPAIYPAVPRGHALIRTAFMSTHKPAQLDRVLEVLDKMARKHRIRVADMAEDEARAMADGEEAYQAQAAKQRQSFL
jgi:glycine C-acetyltransferase